MADGSDSGAPAGANFSGPEETTCNGRKCTACKMPVKDHLGPVGSSKCLVGTLKALADRVAELELVVAERDDDIRKLEALSTKRHGSLLALISSLEERLDSLDSKPSEREGGAKNRGNDSVRSVDDIGNSLGCAVTEHQADPVSPAQLPLGECDGPSARDKDSEAVQEETDSVVLGKKPNSLAEKLSLHEAASNSRAPASDSREQVTRSRLPASRTSTVPLLLRIRLQLTSLTLTVN